MKQLKRSQKYSRKKQTPKILNPELSNADPEGGTGGPDPPPLENHKLYGFL